MSSQVDASTVSAGAFFSENQFVVPDFQRKYSWEVDKQVADFWRDLEGAVGKEEYFLGLIILSELEMEERREVVDGQQRLVTMTILANALRLALLRLGRRLVAESVRTDFLFAMDYATENEEARIELTDDADKADLAALLEADENNPVVLREGSAIHAAHSHITTELETDLDRHENRALRAGQWSEFISKRVTFAIFTHPDRGAAFRVYEVINTRGKDLTPTELVKSFLIGSSGADHREETYLRWKSIEEQLDAVGGLDQLTTFVRHVVTLNQGYVIPRELYRVVSRNYKKSEGVERLLAELTTHLPVYSQMIDPVTDSESTETRTRAFAILDALSMARFRPIFLAASTADDEDSNLRKLVEVIIPGAITGRFGTGSIEAQFARIARRLYQGASWPTELERLIELRPSRDEFLLRFERGLNKQQVLVARSAYIQSDPLPELAGYPHQIRSRGADGWEDFDSAAYREFGGLVANWVLTKAERRPMGARTLADVAARLLDVAVTNEVVPDVVSEPWTVDRVRAESTAMAESLAELWYGPR